MNDATCLAAPQFNQPRRGYRFSADALALAGFAQASPVETVLDLCSGCGVIPILMWQRSPFRYGVGVELDAELAVFRVVERAEARRRDVRLDVGREPAIERVLGPHANPRVQHDHGGGRYDPHLFRHARQRHVD